MEEKLNKQLKTTHSLVKLGSKVGQPLPSINTGLPTLDYEVIQCGGIPKGRIVEFFGPESSGKTSICLHIIGCVQREGGIAAFVDAEHAIDPNYAKTLGVDVDELLISQPDCGEDALETVIALVESGCVNVIVVDSVAALVPRAELDGDMGDSHMGLQARLMSQAMRKLTPIVSKSNCTVIFINQIREKIGVMFGSPETTTGGRALKFFSSVRIDIRRREVIKDGDTIVGHQLELKAVKNKVGTPLKSTKIDLIYGQGIDTRGDYINYAVRLGVIQQSGAWFKFEGKSIAQGLDALRDVLDTQKSLANRVDKEVQRQRAIYASTASTI